MNNDKRENFSLGKNCRTCIGKNGEPAHVEPTCPGHCEKSCFYAVAPQNASYYVCCPCAYMDEQCKSKQGSCGGTVSLERKSEQSSAITEEV
nr:unnamed protein product [Haemonchus contortus]